MPGQPVLRGEVKLAVEREMVLTLIDILDRRLVLLLFSRDRGVSAAELAAALAAPILRWDQERVRQEVSDYRIYAAEHGVPP